MSTTYSPTCQFHPKMKEMGDFQGPFTVSPPPFPSPSDNSSVPMLYCGLVLVGIAALALALYNFFVIMKRNRQAPNGLVEVVNCESTLVSSSMSFKYKKESESDDYECPVCLSGLEEGEEVSKLGRCKHSFHSACIDMWLYSHLDCPICRTPVAQGFSPENSSGGGI
ncbi:hypothetical protein RJT34_33034 [Clitoria ternatea]|uniref:RING-type domain-containing protein n=1 Tax=Clitoria ternatea TaxID=43366 RepID=A0AAN9EYK3_CLITE